ncbi:MAG TPA: hypothetical protein VK179_18505 [Bacteroidales bacterium]|nr:hypothetical protein [Bacteroidales bacterium]
MHILPCFIALTVGTFIYLFFRSSPPSFTQWPVFSFFHKWSPYKPHYIPSWLIGSLPDFLWSFGYSVIITGLWSKHHGKTRYLWLASVPLLVLGFEVLQFFSVLPGTYSNADLFSGFAGMVSGFFIGIKPYKSKYHEKTIT